MNESRNSNIVWILAIVILLTFLTIVISWISSGKLKVEKIEEEKKITETSVKENRFTPESKEKNKLTENPQIFKEENPPKEEKSQNIHVGKEAEKEKEPSKVEEKAMKNEEQLQKEENELKKEEKKLNFALQVGAFSSKDNAITFSKKLNSKGYQTELKEKNNLIIVLIVGFKSMDDLKSVKEKLQKEKVESKIVSYP